jgi:hypothetical protein
LASDKVFAINAITNRLAIWLCPLEDGKVAVDTEVALEVPVKVGGRLGTVVSQGVPTEVITLRSCVSAPIRCGCLPFLAYFGAGTSWRTLSR